MKHVIIVGAYSMYQYVRVRQSDTCAMLGYIGLRRRAPEKLGVWTHHLARVMAISATRYITSCVAPPPALLPPPLAGCEKKPGLSQIHKVQQTNGLS
jgi:hypothetical protein